MNEKDLSEVYKSLILDMNMEYTLLRRKNGDYAIKITDLDCNQSFFAPSCIDDLEKTEAIYDALIKKVCQLSIVNQKQD